MAEFLLQDWLLEQTTLYLMLHHVSKNKISLEKVIELLSYNPAKIYNIKNKGQLKKRL